MLQRIKKWWDRALYWWVVSRHPSFKALYQDFEDADGRGIYWNKRFLSTMAFLVALKSDLKKCAFCGNKTTCDACYHKLPAEGTCRKCKGPLINCPILQDSSGNRVLICGSCVEGFTEADWILYTKLHFKDLNPVATCRPVGEIQFKKPPKGKGTR